MGDVGLFSALIAALDLAPAWKRRLIRDFNHKSSLLRDLQRLSVSSKNARPEYEGVLAALAGSDPKGAHALITDLLSIAGITAVGGRSIGEIADRFLDQAALSAQASLPETTRSVIEQFLALKGAPDEVLSQLRALAKNARLSFDQALDAFESRIRFLVERGTDVRKIAFSTALGRGLDYYSGMVFELHDPQGHVSGQLVAGGRYDGLLTRLGSPAPIAAVGFAVWVERLAALRSNA
jgi:ATP phosphoribosyltransferase regulatory subunit